MIDEVHLRRATVATLVAAGLAWSASGAWAQAPPAQRPDPTPDWLKLDAEYRTETIYINPLDLNGDEFTETWWTEQRARIDLGLRYEKIGGFYLKLDILNGVLFGDNGTFGKVPSPNSGLSVSSKNPNSTAWVVGLPEGRDPLNIDNYGPVLTPVDPIQVTWAYGEVLLPVGLMRVGRMALSDNAGIAGHDGERRNRWGVSRFPDLADRVLFATKLDEAVKSIQHGPGYKANPSINQGLILAVTYDWNVQDQAHIQEDDLRQVNVFLSGRLGEADWFGLRWRDLQLSQVFVNKFGQQFNTDLYAFPFRLEGHVEGAYFNLQTSFITGQTKEVSEGLASLSGKEPSIQDFSQKGAHLFFEYDFGPIAPAIEFDYASGDDDVRSGSPLTSFSFARDFNVGLLLFEHILAFQTARAAAVGIENLSQLDSDSFPVTEIASQGRFSNAVAFFPQVRLDLVDTPRHKFHTRMGVLMAWGDEPVVDPIATSLAEDGREIRDDSVNFHGGKPARFYGVEYDLQIEWTYEDFFTWTVEAAILNPGPALQDIDGQAVTSFMLENRFVFTF